MLALTLTRQIVFDGLISGLVFGLIAMGIVLIYRATRIINFAVGNMGLIGAGLTALLAVEYNVPFWVAAFAGLVIGTLYGAVIEVTIIRRLFAAPRVIVLVATIGIAQLSLAILGSYPEIQEPGAPYPQAIGAAQRIAGVRVAGAQLSILLVVPVVAVALAVFLTRTKLGKSIKASAENPDLARLAGISPKRVSLIVWSLGGALATLSLALMAAQAGSANNLATLGPSTLVRGLVAAVIARMVSFPIAFVAGIALGVAQAAIGFNFLDAAGLVDFLMLVVVLVAVYFQSRQRSSETQTFSFTPKRRPVPERLRSVWWVRHLDRAALGALALLAVVVPYVVTEPSRHLLYTVIMIWAICGISLTVLTGWSGQLSLGQMAFAGIGALTSAAFHRGITVDVGWGDTRVVNAGIEALPMGPSMLLGVLVSAAIAVLVGVGALRVRGLLLAVSTFTFALAAQQYLFRRPILSNGNASSVPFLRTDLFGIDVRQQRTFYYVVLGTLVVLTAAVGRLRRTGVGRTTIAVRDNPNTAAAYTVEATRVKLRAFALAGGIAGLGGALFGGALQTVPLSERFFTVQDSLLLVSIVVIGGLGSVVGPVLGALWVIGLPAFFPENDIVPLLASSIGLLVLLLYFPGGFIQLGYSARDVVLGWAERRLGPAPAKQSQSLPPVLSGGGREPAPAGVAAVAANGITVRFGGNVAVDDVSIHLDQGEIVGLIGTNGAGKSTLMNALGGYLPSKGNVELLGRDITPLSPAGRARLGLARTFQAATLFPELSVRETIQVALEARHRTGLLSSALCLPHALRADRARSKEADELVDFLGLGRYADAYIADLSTGTRRIVELAGLLALDARVLCLDEPTAGLAQRETEAFGPLLLELRRELCASLLVIEHDMPLIMSISDRVYCLELGRVIAEGSPQAVRADPAVIASYLGTDERAIARSGATTQHRN